MIQASLTRSRIYVSVRTLTHTHAPTHPHTLARPIRHRTVFQLYHSQQNSKKLPVSNFYSTKEVSKEIRKTTQPIQQYQVIKTTKLQYSKVQATCHHYCAPRATWLITTVLYSVTLLRAQGHVSHR